MEELVKKLVLELKLTEEQAKKVVDMTVGYVKEKTGDHGLIDKLGGWAGDAKDKIVDLAGDAKEKMGDLADDAGEAFDKAKGYVSGVWDKVTGDKKEEKKEEKR